VSAKRSNRRLPLIFLVAIANGIYLQDHLNRAWGTRAVRSPRVSRLVPRPECLLATPERLLPSQFS
jgi:hypothetical protein